MKAYAESSDLHKEKDHKMNITLNEAEIAKVLENYVKDNLTTGLSPILLSSVLTYDPSGHIVYAAEFASDSNANLKRDMLKMYPILGQNYIPVIKEVRTRTNWGLKEAKDFVDTNWKPFVS
jgi:hypothetical protein